VRKSFYLSNNTVGRFYPHSSSFFFLRLTVKRMSRCVARSSSHPLLATIELHLRFFKKKVTAPSFPHFYRPPAALSFLLCLCLQRSTAASIHSLSHPFATAASIHSLSHPFATAASLRTPGGSYQQPDRSSNLAAPGKCRPQFTAHRLFLVGFHL